MASEDFQDWKLIIRPFVAVYTPQTGGGPNYYPGRYVGQTVTVDGIVYDFAGADSLIPDQVWGAASPAGVICMMGDYIFDNSFSTPDYAAQQLKPNNLSPDLFPAIVTRTTLADWFVGTTGGSTGDDFSFSGSGIRTAVGADGLGAFYTLLNPEFDAFRNWSGIDVDFECPLVWTGQYFVYLAPTNTISRPYHRVRVYRSTDEQALAFEFITEIEPQILPDNWITYTHDAIISNGAFATRGGSAGGTDQIMYYDEGETRSEIPFPSSIAMIADGMRVADNLRIYTQGVDYTVNTTAHTISWALPGLEPTAGKLYDIRYRYEDFANWPIAAVSPLNGVIYAVLAPTFYAEGVVDPVTGLTTYPIQAVVSHDHGSTWAALGSIPTTLDHGGDQAGSLGWLDGGVNGPSGGVLIMGLRDGIWRSEDGGFTWAQVTKPSPSGFVTDNEEGVIFEAQAFFMPKVLTLNGTDALMTMNDVSVPAGLNGAYFAGRILKTRDGGLTWEQVYLQDQPTIGTLLPNSNDAPDAIARINDTEILSISQFGTMYWSGDAGDTWSVVEPYSQAKIDHFTFSNESQFATVDGRHALFGTAPDGGLFVNVPVATLCGNTIDRQVRRGRTVAVAEIEYLYRWEANAQDFGAGGARELIFEVQARTFVQGKQQLGEISRIHVSNPAPDMTGIVPATVALPGALFVDWSSYISPDLDLDHFEVRYGFVNNPLAMTSIIKRAKDQNNVIIPNLVQSLTVYLHIVPFDAFGEGLPSEIVSAVPLATISLSA